MLFQDFCNHHGDVNMQNHASDRKIQLQMKLSL